MTYRCVILCWKGYCAVSTTLALATEGFLPQEPKQQSFLQPSLRTPAPGPLGLVFPRELADEKRWKQQEMQRALDEQIQLQNQQCNGIGAQATLAEPKQQSFLQQNAGRAQVGLVFPGQLTDEKEKRRKQQQEMQNALDEQIKEQRARKEQERRQKVSMEEPEKFHVESKYSAKYVPQAAQAMPSPMHGPQAAVEEARLVKGKKMHQNHQNA